MNKVFFKLSDNSFSSINIKKLGMTIRKINNDEIENITDNIFNKVLTKQNRRIINIGHKILVEHDVDIINNENDRKLFEEMNSFLGKITIEEKNNFFNLMDIEKRKLNKRNFKKSIESLCVLEIDEATFKKIYDIDRVNYILHSLFMFSYYISSKELEIENLKSNFIFLKLDNISIENIKGFIQIFSLENYYIPYDFNSVELITNLMNKKDIYFNMSFLSMIDSIFNTNASIENNIINKVSIIERFLIKKNDPKDKQFVLKMGAICFNKSIKIERLSEVLKNIYEIRSILVHGNEKLLFDNMEHYIKVFNVTQLKDNKYANRFVVLVTVSVYLDILLKEFLIEYINNNDYCEYLKNN